MIICFDLDDTLYDEINYVKSGFRSVSKYLSDLNFLRKSENQIFKDLIDILNCNGRGKVIDIFLHDNEIYSKNLVLKCLSVYRKHKPVIKLNSNVSVILRGLKKKYGNLYLVTDGNLVVQRNKINALNLKKYFKKTIPTHQYGITNAKPSIYAFKKISIFEKKKISDIIYIGDNPNKDFIELKKNGATTIRINQGMFKDLILDEKYMADYEITNLKYLEKILNKL